MDNESGILQKTNEIPVMKFTDTNALALKIDLDLSQREYLALRSHLETLNLKILPCKEKIIQEQKKCYPEDIIADNHSATVPLQQLLNKSCERLLESFGESVSSFNNNMKLYVKMGMDGQSGHSKYQQPKQGNDFDDSSIFFCGNYNVKAC